MIHGNKNRIFVSELGTMEMVYCDMMQQHQLQISHDTVTFKIGNTFIKQKTYFCSILSDFF